MTMTLVSTITLASNASAITFSSIPQTATDLMVVYSLRSNAGGDPNDYIAMTFNGTSTGYTDRDLRSSSSSVFADTNTTSYLRYTLGATGNTATANTFGNASFYIPNYSGSTNKPVSSDGASETNAAATGKTIMAGIWANTAAITSISVIPILGTVWLTNSVASLYTITKGSGGATVS